MDSLSIGLVLYGCVGLVYFVLLWQVNDRNKQYLYAVPGVILLLATIAIVIWPILVVSDWIKFAVEVARNRD